MVVKVIMTNKVNVTKLNALTSQKHQTFLVQHKQHQFLLKIKSMKISGIKAIKIRN